MQRSIDSSANSIGRPAHPVTRPTPSWKQEQVCSLRSRCGNVSKLEALSASKIYLELAEDLLQITSTALQPLTGKFQGILLVQDWLSMASWQALLSWHDLKHHVS